MYQLKCIGKTRDKNNHIIEYKLIGNDRKIISVKSDELKEFIRSGQVGVINLTLTSDNRLIDKKSDTPSKPNINIESLLNRLKSLSYILNAFDTACGHKCYIASSPDNLKHIFIIPDDVKYIYDLLDNFIYNNELHIYMSNIEGALKVIGGKNLISAKRMFFQCAAQHIDIRSFDTSNITNMQCMFACCDVQSLDLSSFDTGNVTDMKDMFYACKAQSIDLRSFDTSKVTNMGGMFSDCETQYLDLSSFDTSNVTDMRYMFNECKVQSLDLRSFNTSKVTTMHAMFAKCEAQSIDLSSFDTSNTTAIGFMFDECKAQIKANDPKLKSHYRAIVG